MTSIYNNNFINNYKQATGGSSNTFSTSIPTGGNFWNDYSTIAQGCGDANSDNFCDTPYPFTGGTVGVVDNYPWTIQNGWHTIITTEGNKTVTSTNNSPVAVSYVVTAKIDNTHTSVICSPQSGSMFSIGSTIVTCTASTGVKTSFTVTVKQPDTTPPIVTAPANQQITATSNSGAVVNYPAPTATDNIGVTSGPTCTPSSGSIFPIGTTTVTCTASDNAGNIGRATFTVAVTLPTTPSNEIDIALGAGGSANAACVAANNCFSPHSLSVAPGTTVTWKNTDVAMHVICSGKSTYTECGKVFEEDSLKLGKTFQFTFANAGTYDYYCSIHPWMTGQVIVGSGVQPIPVSSSVLTATTDKPFYNKGEKITISGHVPSIHSDDRIFVKIFDSNNNLVGDLGAGDGKDGILVLPDGTYAGTIDTSLPIWETGGTHTVIAQYGNLQAKTDFSIGWSTSIQSPLSSTINVHTGNVDKIYNNGFYVLGDQLIISGEITYFVPSNPVIIQIMDSKNNLVMTRQINLTADSKYLASIKLDGTPWTKAEVYTIKSINSADQNYALTQFQILGQALTETNSGIVSVPTVTKGNVDVQYTLQNGRAFGIQPSIKNTSLILEFEADNDGKIIIDLPRDLLDSKSQTGADTKFVVKLTMNDGKGIANTVGYDEVISDRIRTITIPFNKGPESGGYQESIQIIGTQFDGRTWGPFEENPTLVSKWQLPPIHNNEINSPIALDFDSSNNIFVITTQGAIQELSPEGKLLLQVGSINANSIGIDSNNNIYVSDGVNNNIQKFSHNGKFIMKWNTTDNNGVIVNPFEINIDSSNNILVEVRGSNINEYSSDGKLVKIFNGGYLDPNMPGNIKTTDSSDNYYKSWPASSGGGREMSFVNKYSKDNTLLISWGQDGAPALGENAFYYIPKIVVDSSDNVYVIGSLPPKIQKFSPTGKLLLSWNLPKEFLGMTKTGEFYLYDSNTQLIEKYLINSTTIQTSSQSNFTSIFTPTQQDIQNINQAKANQTIAAEVNIGNGKTNTTSIDNNVSVQTTSNTPDSLNVNVSAPNQTGPKVIAFNLAATTINVASLKNLGIMYDGKLIQPAPNMDAILHAKPTDSPSFAIVVTQSGVQVLVLVPHFSTHSITITNMSKVIPVVPEFPFAVIVLAIATLSIILIPKIRHF